MTTETTSHVSSGMNTRLIATAADVISRAMQQGRTLPAALAVALDSAQLLQSPETAAEHERVRTKYLEAADTVARLVLQRGERAKVENALRDEVEQLQARVAELESMVGTARAMHVKYPDSEHCQYDGGQWPCPTMVALGMAAETDQFAPLAPQGQQARTILDRARDALDARMTKDDLRHVLSNVIAYTAELEARIAEYERPADGITRRIAPVQALREDSQGGAC